MAIGWHQGMPLDLAYVPYSPVTAITARSMEADAISVIEGATFSYKLRVCDMDTWQQVGTYQLVSFPNSAVGLSHVLESGTLMAISSLGTQAPEFTEVEFRVTISARNVGAMTLYRDRYRPIDTVPSNVNYAAVIDSSGSEVIVDVWVNPEPEE